MAERHLAHGAQARIVIIAGRVARNHVVLGGTTLLIAPQRFRAGKGTHVAEFRQTKKVDFESTASEHLALQARVVQLTCDSDDSPP